MFLGQGQIILILFCLVCIYQDLSSRKVSNRVVLVGLFISILVVTLTAGASGLLLGLGGFATAFGLGFLLWRFNVLGAGDVKVLSVLALTLSWKLAIELVFYSLVWGSLLGIASFFLEGGFLRSLAQLNFSAIMTIRNLRVFRDHKIPFTVAIFLGLFSVWLLDSKGVHWL